jgi:hypothetical protein
MRGTAQARVGALAFVGAATAATAVWFSRLGRSSQGPPPASGWGTWKTPKARDPRAVGGGPYR